MELFHIQWKYNLKRTSFLVRTSASYWAQISPRSICTRESMNFIGCLFLMIFSTNFPKQCNIQRLKFMPIIYHYIQQQETRGRYVAFLYTNLSPTSYSDNKNKTFLKFINCWVAVGANVTYRDWEALPVICSIVQFDVHAWQFSPKWLTGWFGSVGGGENQGKLQFPAII